MTKYHFRLFFPSEMYRGTTLVVSFSLSSCVSVTFWLNTSRIHHRSHFSFLHISKYRISAYIRLFCIWRNDVFHFEFPLKDQNQCVLIDHYWKMNLQMKFIVRRENQSCELLKILLEYWFLKTHCWRSLFDELIERKINRLTYKRWL
jgi:hypothetical protein